jgi:predicted DsbA family dithiol-disulfide isomerase
MLARLKRSAREAGLPFGDRVKTFNSRLAQELAKWAEQKGKGDLYHMEVFYAYFAEGKNIGKASVLLDRIQAIGLSVREAAEVLKGGRFRSDVDKDWLRSHQLGITAVPTLVFNGRHLVGAQPYASMESFMIENSAKRLG